MSVLVPPLAPGHRDVTAPVLGARCLPGCHTPEVDRDGTHLCVITVGVVPARNTQAVPDGETCTVAVEVTQEQTTAGVLSRHVAVLTCADSDWHGDAIDVEPDDIPALIQALQAAYRVAKATP